MGNPSVTNPVLHDFRIERPRFVGNQKDFFDWLPEAHAKADLSDGKVENQLERYRKIMRRVGCSPEQIETRGYEIKDFSHAQWSEMEIFRLDEAPAGVGMEVRTRYFDHAVQRVFENFYAQDISPPDDLIHVTCTGYVSPSAAQRLVADKEWGNVTQVTHAYHMGCYAAFPAVRQARGFLAAEPLKKRIDIVHTEICGLHLNPADHALENFVVQTLFADGFVRYTLGQSLPEAAPVGLELLTLKEVVLPKTQAAMTWICGDHGMRMTLSKDVPSLVAQALPSFLQSFLRAAGFERDQICAEARFAVHPGGPKILDQVKTSLGLKEEQIEVSREILRTHGNMSSATLPHIWEKMASDPKIPPGALIVSLAFGPGLTVCGALLRKIAH